MKRRIAALLMVVALYNVAGLPLVPPLGKEERRSVEAYR